VSQFTSGFWDVYIAIVSVVSIVACAVFLKTQSKRKVASAKVETTGHVWDEDLAEYNNPLPRWWSWLFYITVVFALVYLVLYPGLGSWPGTLGWTQVGQLEQENARAQAQFGPLYEKFAAMDVKAIAGNSQARAIGEKLFLNNCAQCHASDAGGSRGFPNLTDRDWLWGGDPAAIRTTITDGRTGIMPPFGPALGEGGTKDVAHYVMSLSGGTHDSIRRARGEALFKSTCAACHEPTIIQTITQGRTNQMPAHKGLLSGPQIHLLTGYIWSLSAPTE
jgi:cytochrome c oxidase cbb3-type subunit 3